jgi:hypothetical protein
VVDVRESPAVHGHEDECLAEGKVLSGADLAGLKSHAD